MKPALDFDIEKIAYVEFGIGKRYREGPRFVIIPVDKKVQDTLHEMLQATWAAMRKVTDGDNVIRYEPGNEYASKEHLYIPKEGNAANFFQDLYTLEQIDIDIEGLSEPTQIFCYFARFLDKKHRRLVALRQSKHFKGILKSKGRLIQLIDDTLKIIEDDTFKLDTDFDVLVDSNNIHILRPKAFEHLGGLKKEILDAVSSNIQALKKKLPFINFENIEAYAKKHLRAAQYLASIKEDKLISSIDKRMLINYCKEVKVSIKEVEGELVVEEGNELSFLQVLDRRLYDVKLIPGNPERYRATNRKKVD